MSTAQGTNILREYLMALGFRVNTTEERRMDTSVLKMDRRMLALGKSAVAAATAVVTVTTVVAKSWEKLFYAARYADTTVEKLQGIEFGARNIGIEAGKMTGTVKQFAAMIRGNPGLQGFLESMGVKVQGRTKEDVLMDFVEKLKSMPFYIAQRAAAMFGIDPETLFNMEQGLDKMREAAKLREQMNKDAGLDADKAAKAGLEYMNMWRQVTARASVLGQVLMLDVLPAVRDLVGETDKLLLKWTNIVNDIEKSGSKDFWQKIREGLTGKAEGGTRATLTKEQRARLGLPEKDMADRVHGDGTGLDVTNDTVGIAKAWDEFQQWRARRGAVRAGKQDPYADRQATDNEAVFNSVDNSDFKKGGTGGSTGGGWQLPPAYPMGTKNINPLTPEQAAYLAALEKKYNLPSGLLDRMYVVESGRGRNLHSPTGANGPFQFVRKTAKEFGIEGREMDFHASADAAARKIRGELRMYDGDPRQALTAYNWGEGNLSKYQLGQIPITDEAKGYADKVLNPGATTINQEVHIDVHGGGDPHETAQSVVRLQGELAKDLIRYNAPKVR